MHADFRAVSASTGLCTDRTSPIPAELAAISIPQGVQAPQGSTTLAVIVSGQLRALGTPDGLSAMQRFLSAALEFLHLYLHVSARNGRSAACSHANGENRIMSRRLCRGCNRSGTLLATFQPRPLIARVTVAT